MTDIRYRPPVIDQPHSERRTSAETGSTSRGGSAAGWLLAAITAAVVAYALVAGTALVVVTIGLLSQSTAACISATTPVSAISQPAANPAAPVNVSIASWNAYGKKSTAADIVSGIRALSRVADVIGLQEMNPDRRRLAVARSITNFGWALSKGRNAVPIAWNTLRYRMVAQDSKEVFGVRRIEQGVSGRTIGPKSQQWVQLQDRRTGGQFFVLNFHLIPSIEQHRQPAKNRPIRLRLAAAQLAAAVAQGNQLKAIAPVALTGDHNMADPAAWLRTRLNPDGYYSSYQALGQTPLGTHGNRRIDYVWLTANTLTAARHLVLGSNSTRTFAKSDHRPLVVTVTNRPTGTAATRNTPAPNLVPDAASGADQIYSGLLDSNCTPCPGTEAPATGAAGTTRTGDWDKMGDRDPDGKPPITGVLEPTVRKASEIVNYVTARGIKIDTVYAAPPNPSMWGTGEHGMGRAIDVMVGSIRDGDVVADYTWRNRERLRVKWIVWNHQIRSPERNNGAWRPYSGTDNPHTDHPHIFFDESPYLAPRGAAALQSVTPAGAAPRSTAAATPSSSQNRWSNPIKGGALGARFGATGLWARHHTGDDYRAGQGTEIHSVAAGRVVFAGNTGNWAGNHVAVKHTDGWTTMYSHMSQILATTGQTVTAGATLGLVGSTGRAFGAHLHFETYPPGVRYGDVYRATDPQKYMARLRQHDGPSAGSTVGTRLARATFGGVKLDATQVERAAKAVATVGHVARELGWNDTTRRKAAFIALITPMQESTMGANPASRRRDRYGDGGFNGQRSKPGWYGTLEQTLDPVYATQKFLLGHTITQTVPGGAGPKGYHIPGLNDIKGWESMAPTRAAQAVQISAYPDLYAQWYEMARDLLAYVEKHSAATGDVSDAPACAPDPELQTSTKPAAIPASANLVRAEPVLTQPVDRRTDESRP